MKLYVWWKYTLPAQRAPTPNLIRNPLQAPRNTHHGRRGDCRVNATMRILDLVSALVGPGAYLSTDIQFHIRFLGTLSSDCGFGGIAVGLRVRAAHPAPRRDVETRSENGPYNRQRES